MFTESTLEDMLYENPQKVFIGRNGWPIERWIARQYIVPSGVIDLLGITRDKKNRPIPVVVELKNRPLKSEDVAQVLRYSSDINDILLWLAVRNSMQQIDDAIMALIGPCEPSNKVLFESIAANVSIHMFTVSSEIEVSGCYEWNKDFRKSIEDKGYWASKSSIFSVFLEQGE